MRLHVLDCPNGTAICIMTQGLHPCPAFDTTESGVKLSKASQLASQEAVAVAGLIKHLSCCCPFNTSLVLMVSEEEPRKCSMLNKPCLALAQAAKSHAANGLPCRPNGPHAAAHMCTCPHVHNVISAKPAGVEQLFRHKHGTVVQVQFPKIIGFVLSCENLLCGDGPMS